MRIVATTVLVVVCLLASLGAVSTPLAPRVVYVDTLAQLKQLVPVPGTTVVVAGRAAVGDGGGGTWVYSNDADYIDDCTAVCADSDLSSEQTLSTSTTVNQVLNTDLAYGTVYATMTNGLVIADKFWHKHGAVHSLSSAPTTTPYIDYKTGAVHDRGVFDAYSSGSFTVKYKYATNARRWKRVWDGQSFKLEWLAAADSDAGNELCWALNHAKRLGADEVSLGGKTFRYWMTTEMPNGVALVDGTLRVRSIDPVYQFRTSYSWTDITTGAGIALADHLDFVRAHVMAGDTLAYPHIVQMVDATKIRIERVEIDGNQYAFNESNSTLTTIWHGSVSYSESVALLHESPTWSGIAFGPHSSRTVPSNGEVLLRDVTVHDTGAMCIAISGAYDSKGENLKVYNSIGNHLIYGFGGTIDRLHVSGFAIQGLLTAYHLNINDLTVENLAENPEFAGNPTGLYTHRGMDYGDNSLNTDINLFKQGFVLDKFFIDLGTIGSIPVLFDNTGDHISIRNGVVFGPTAADERVGLISSVGNVQQSLWRNHVVENVSLYRRGSAMTISESLGNGYLCDNLIVRDVTIKDLRGYTTPVFADGEAFGAYLWAIMSNKRNDPDFAKGMRMRFDNVVNRSSSTQALLFCNVLVADGAPVTALFNNCVWIADGNGILYGSGGTGRWNAMTVDDHSKIKLIWRDCVFPDLSNVFENAELFYALSYFDDCRTTAGRVSDWHGVHDATVSSGATFIDLTTNLMWGSYPTANSTWNQRDVEILIREHTSTNMLVPERAFLHKSGTAIESVTDQRDPVLRVPLTAALGGDTTITFSATVRLRPPR